MLTKINTSIEHIVAKIDNDFNPDNSDWIPRVAAWTIEAMSNLKVLRKEIKKRKLIVKDRIAYSSCPITKNDIIVYDNRGCKLDYASNDVCSSTGKCMQSNSAEISNTIDIINNPNNIEINNTIFQQVDNEYPSRYNAYSVGYNQNINRNYVIINNNKIELNFDTDFIYVESSEVVTICSEIYGCKLPVVPNNGILIEAIVAWCMYKMLCRGYKHTVLNLTSNSPALNPYIAWITLKDKAVTSIILDEQGETINDNMLWQSPFYIHTLDPKRK